MPSTDPVSLRRTALVDRLTSRRGAWATLLLALVLGVGAIGGLRAVEAPPRAGAAPVTSESARVAGLVAQFPDAGVQSVLLVVTRADGAELTPTDTAAATALAADLPTPVGHRAGPATVAEDGRAAIVQVPMQASPDSGVDADTITHLRELVRAGAPSGLSVLVTGGPAFAADIAQAFDGADVTLLLVTISVVALLLLLTYRSPVLWLVPLVVVGLADQVAAVLTKALGSALDLSFDAGIVSVLVFGAGTNYAMLLISRYREELHHDPDHRSALPRAWRATVPAILASNATVVVALATLVLAVVPGTRGLGAASALGLVVAVLAVLLLLPATLAVLGRRVFWPRIPLASPSARPATSLWEGLATRVVARPAAVVGAAVVALAVMSTGLVGATVGLTQADRFRVASESATGLDVLGEHFPAGAAQPLTVVTRAERVDEVATTLSDVPGVASVRPAPDVDGFAVARVSVITTADPGSAAARDTVAGVRAAAHDIIGADALVGGQQAVDVDARKGNTRDLLLLAPLVLLVSALVLVALTRSLLAPLVLLGVNILSALATIGAGSWIGRHLLDWPALDLQVPLLSFLFLVALGIDYTIFLVHRARSEAAAHGTRDGMVRAVAGTGAVITSAGIVLAAVFTALGVLPLVALGQLGLIVGLGVVLDTVLVRTVLVPGLFGLLGDRIWWPGRVARTPAADPASTTAEPALVG